MTHRPVATVGRPTAGGEPLGPAVASFLAERDLAPSSHGSTSWPSTGSSTASAPTPPSPSWTSTSPATGLERRRPRSDRAAPARARAIPTPELLAFLDADHPVRERTLWWRLYETAARAGEVLALNVADLDRRAGAPWWSARRPGGLGLPADD